MGKILEIIKVVIKKKVDYAYFDISQTVFGKSEKCVWF